MAGEETTQRPDGSPEATGDLGPVSPEVERGIDSEAQVL